MKDRPVGPVSGSLGARFGILIGAPGLKRTRDQEPCLEEQSLGPETVVGPSRSLLEDTSVRR